MATRDQQQHHERPLRRLLGDRCDHRGGDRRGAVEGELVDRLQQQRDRGRDQRSPAERGGQQRRGLGLVAVQPHEGGHQRADRQRGQDQPDRQRARGSRGQQHQRHHGGAQDHRDADQHGERGVGPARAARGRSGVLRRAEGARPRVRWCPVHARKPIGTYADRSAAARALAGVAPGPPGT